MAWNPNIPQPVDIISDSQNDILSDYGALNTFVGVNHVAFNDPDQGKHKFVQYPSQSSVPTMGASEVGLYCAPSTQSNPVVSPNIYFVSSSNASVNEFGGGVAGDRGSEGWTRLPSGMLMKWKTIGLAAGSSGTLFGSYTGTWSVNSQMAAFQATPISITASAYIVASANRAFVTVSARPISATQFNIIVTPTFLLTGWPLFYVRVFAIGS